MRNMDGKYVRLTRKWLYGSFSMKLNYIVAGDGNICSIPRFFAIGVGTKLCSKRKTRAACLCWCPAECAASVSIDQVGVYSLSNVIVADEKSTSFHQYLRY